jgi:GT2 family glycosyltransferase
MMPTSHSQSAPTFRLLSVLMPVHNDLTKLRAAIARILGSAVSVPLELVCVDTGSLDGSDDLLDELAATDDRIRVIRHPANSGRGSALREAIRHMRGDIAIIQDASDSKTRSAGALTCHHARCGRLSCCCFSRKCLKGFGGAQVLSLIVVGRKLLRSTASLFGRHLTGGIPVGVAFR